jgi:DNA-binding response OmpR family regulator
MSPEPNEKVRMNRKHIVVVNGAPLFLDLMRLFLNDQNYNVTTTNFVPRTFDQIGGLQPDLLIIDLTIGQQAGWDLLERLRLDALTHSIPVIVVSTMPHLLEQARADADRFGGQLFLSKPFNLDDLLAGIRSLIGEAAGPFKSSAVPIRPDGDVNE